MDTLNLAYTLDLFNEVLIPRINDELNPCISISFNPQWYNLVVSLRSINCSGCTCSSDHLGCSFTVCAEIANAVFQSKPISIPACRSADIT
jgi:hypothetical protein